ncbi:hypothetical protein PH213_34700 [Streptomyces sp. SRF1]|uniref:hypothetical protein n=1 Tax=Streptomyces sp. SRF1 TaxID=1549642 RepID=UPI0025AF3FBB|nr:hypothetical protein [Streptomyces sp. SRF1]MDN3059594.1 hypothetical protein [Streptomyces sp. SRF1]
MPTVIRPRGRSMPPALDEINRRIRLLMDEPADKRRAEEYTRLLVLWAEATAANGSCWGKAA